MSEEKNSLQQNDGTNLNLDITINEGDETAESVIESNQNTDRPEPDQPTADFFETIAENEPEITGMYEYESDEKEKGEKEENAKKNRMDADELIRRESEVITQMELITEDQQDDNVEEIKSDRDADDKQISSEQIQETSTETRRKSVIQFDDVKEEEDPSHYLMPKTSQETPSMPTLTRKSLIYSYGELGPRIEETKIGKQSIDEFDIFEIDEYPPLFDIVEEEEEVEQLIAVEESEESILDRVPFYEKYDKCIEEISWRKIRNFILQKKLVMYFKKKKVHIDFKTSTSSYEALKKYHLKLESYGELIKRSTTQQIDTTTQIAELKEKHVDKAMKIKDLFQHLQYREREIGIGLIFAKTGNIISEKVVDFFIKRQSKRMQILSSMRLEYCKLRIMIQEKLDKIDTLNEIAPGYFMHRYEKLKQDNRSFADKIEELDMELSRLREKFSKNVHILAHFKEKSTAFTIDLNDLNDELNHLKLDCYWVRSQMNNFKKDRMHCMKNITRIKENSGLLTEPTLLRQMEIDMENYQEQLTYFNEIKNQYKIKSEQIKNIRRNIQQMAAAMKMSI